MLNQFYFCAASEMLATFKKRETVRMKAITLAAIVGWPFLENAFAE